MAFLLILTWFGIGTIVGAVGYKKYIESKIRDMVDKEVEKQLHICR